MNHFALIFLIVVVVALLSLPRKWAPLPLLASACYMTLGQGLEIGAISLPIYRMVLLAGLVRIVLRGERAGGRANAIDKLLIAWSLWVFLASFFHLYEPGSGPVYAAGFILNISLSYFLIRVWCDRPETLLAVIRGVAFLLVPVAIAMLLEHLIHQNLFSVFGGIPEDVPVRDGKIRSQGPFAHSILAGTVGAVCIPYMLGLWQRHALTASIGLAACLSMVILSNSSGPLMSTVFGVLAVLMWPWREWTRALRYSAVALYLALDLVMTRPAYYLISKIDLTGSSTGWHRSRLIEVAMQHFSEWWLFGTDYTAHWMAYSLNEQHSDITNYYLFIGIIGGFLALVLVLIIIWKAFLGVGTLVRVGVFDHPQDRFMVWCLGAGLFAHAVTCLSVAYFDQSAIFFWLNIAVISAFYSSVTLSTAEPERNVASIRRSRDIQSRRLARSKLMRSTRP